MAEVDLGELPEIGPDGVAARVEAIQLRALRNTMSRAAAVERGRLLGEQTADQRGETGQDKAQRAARAKAYAAWEYDGKPAGGTHLVEFGVAQQSEALRALTGPDFKKGGK